MRSLLIINLFSCPSTLELLKLTIWNLIKSMEEGIESLTDAELVNINDNEGNHFQVYDLIFAWKVLYFRFEILAYSLKEWRLSAEHETQIINYFTQYQLQRKISKRQKKKMICTWYDEMIPNCIGIGNGYGFQRRGEGTIYAKKTELNFHIISHRACTQFIFILFLFGFCRYRNFWLINITNNSRI